jgi:putative ABC transport system permease protein
MSALAEEPLSISWLGLGLCVLWMGVISLGASRSLGLGLEKQLGVAAVRCLVQLSFLGYLLVPIFRMNNWALTLGYLAVMLVAAAAEAAGRPSHAYAGMYGHVLLGLAGGALASAFYGLTLVLHAGVSAQYAIPITVRGPNTCCGAIAATCGNAYCLYVSV